MTPPKYAIDLAVQVSGLSPCQSKRGVVIFSCGHVVSHGYNYKPRGFECDGTANCKATCRREAVHAEQSAILAAGNRAHGSEMLHIKTVDGKIVESGGPSCVECSKLARAAGIAWVWLYHADGWRRYSGEEFHRLSIAASGLSPTSGEALAWIRKKLRLPEDAQMFSGQETIAGRLHVWDSHQHGYMKYIEAYKCDDKQGEIARLSVRVRELEEGLPQ